MRRLFSVAVLGIVAAGLMLAMPSASQAQSCDYGGYGRSYGGAGFSGYSGYGGNSGYYDRGYAPAAPSYGGYSGPVYTPGYGGFYGRRPVIEHPTSGHWTPSRGYHEHGHIHVPHRGHSHTRPY